MGLDVYVGSLTRYHGGDWETVVQQAAREQGIDVHVLRVEEAAESTRKEEEFHSLVEEAVEGLRERGYEGQVVRQDEKPLADPK